MYLFYVSLHLLLCLVLYPLLNVTQEVKRLYYVHFIVS